MSFSFKVVIPARYASSRLPGKPLLELAGKPMLHHVLDAVAPLGPERVVVVVGPAMEAVAEWVSTNVDCECLVYPVDKRNIASRKIPERLGGRIISERTVQNESGSVLDEVVYRIPLKSDAD